MTLLSKATLLVDCRLLLGLELVDHSGGTATISVQPKLWDHGYEPGFTIVARDGISTGMVFRIATALLPEITTIERVREDASSEFVAVLWSQQQLDRLPAFLRPDALEVRPAWTFTDSGWQF